MITPCVFCKIVAGEIPSTRLYEDEDTLVFMDIAPIIQGHALVIPKRHYDPLTATPVPVLQALIAVIRAVAQAQTQALKADGINVMQANGAAAGQVVPHLHFHVIPRFNTDGHSWNWNPRSYSDPADMRQLADTIRQAWPQE